MGELRQRGNVWWVRYYRNGRRHEESSGSTKQGDADRLLKLREGDVARGVPITPKVGRLRFEDAVAEVLKDYQINGKRSLDDVEARVRLHLIPHFGGRRMANITTGDVRAFVSKRQAAGASNAEVNRELAIVKRAYSLAIEANDLLARPHIPMLDEKHNVRQGFFERDDFERVRDLLPAPLRGVVTFAYLTGWRVQSEVLPLTWAQVKRQTKTIELQGSQTKNGEARTLPYGTLPELAAVMETQWTERERLAAAGTITPYVFHRAGKPVRTFRRAWMSACRAAEVPGRIVHDFRRTAVRNFERAGVSRSVAMKITGHKTESVYRRYAIVREGDIAEGLGKLAGTEKGQSAPTGRVARFRAARK